KQRQHRLDPDRLIAPLVGDEPLLRHLRRQLVPELHGAAIEASKRRGQRAGHLFFGGGALSPSSGVGSNCGRAGAGSAAAVSLAPAPSSASLGLVSALASYP